VRVTFTIDAPTPELREAAQGFMDWMSNSGEQEYWTGAEYGDIEKVLTQFKYDWKNLTFTAELREEE
jgi:hypothetical protein